MRALRRVAVVAAAMSMTVAGMTAPASAAAAQLPLDWKVGGQPATAQQVVDYWGLGALKFANDQGHAPSAVSSGHDDALSSPTPKTGLSAKTVGKLFILKSTTNTAEAPEGEIKTTCSGNVVVSANKSVVLTAGHCAIVKIPFSTEEIMLNGVFIPGFDGTTLDAKATADPDGYPDAQIAPHGVWAVTNVFLTGAWNAAPFFAAGQDMAALTVRKPGSSQRIEDVTGGQQVAFNRPRTGQRTVIGYPQDNTRAWYHPSRNTPGVPVNSTPPAPINHGVPASDQRENDGKVMIQTTGTAWQGGWPYLDPQLASALSAGSSGGPWFEEYDPLTGEGIQTAVSSRFDGDPIAPDIIASWYEGPHLVGTYFEAQQQEAYQAAAAATP
ncbi:trypsin-like serine peptidase [Nonomuraea sp. NPDC048826]|uniref:trypsin-like serine peptidase n=1 Tax=Nonomuraea sp. NPDC048826 TaxID=3364347 RepID=UPI003712AE95